MYLIYFSSLFISDSKTIGQEYPYRKDGENIILDAKWIYHKFEILGLFYQYQQRNIMIR